MHPDDDRPRSAAALAAELGDRVPPASTVSPDAERLVSSTRALVEAVVLADVGDDDRRRAADALDAVIADLRRAVRDEPLALVRHPDGRVESLLQAGSGRLNPQAPAVTWVELPAPPPAGEAPVLVEVRARCAFTAAHAGSPGRVHGGALAALLDEVLGNAVTASGAPGMTVSLTVELRAAVPIGGSVDVVARCTGVDGRKRHASGEIVVADGTVAATATAVFVAVR